MKLFYLKNKNFRMFVLIISIFLIAVAYQAFASYLISPSGLKYPNPGHYPEEIGPGSFNCSGNSNCYWKFPNALLINSSSSLTCFSNNICVYAPNKYFLWIRNLENTEYRGIAAKDLYLGGSYIRGGPTGIKVEGNLDMDNHNINNVNQINANKVSANQICLNNDCKTNWPGGGGISGTGKTNYIAKWTGSDSLGYASIEEKPTLLEFYKGVRIPTLVVTGTLTSSNHIVAYGDLEVSPAHRTPLPSPITFRKDITIEPLWPVYTVGAWNSPKVTITSAWNPTGTWSPKTYSFVIQNMNPPNAKLSVQNDKGEELIGISYEGNLDMNNHDIINANKVSANQICLNDDCKTSWPGGIGSVSLYLSNSNPYTTWVYLTWLGEDTTLSTLYNTISAAQGTASVKAVAVYDPVSKGWSVYVSGGSGGAKTVKKGYMVGVAITNGYKIVDLPAIGGLVGFGQIMADSIKTKKLCIGEICRTGWYSSPVYFIKKGWDLVSFPFFKSNGNQYKVSELISEMNSQGCEIYRYFYWWNPETNSYKDFSGNDLVDPSKSYWILSFNSCKYTPKTDRYVTAVVLNLKTGGIDNWNMVGLPICLVGVDSSTLVKALDLKINQGEMAAMLKLSGAGSIPSGISSSTYFIAPQDYFITNFGEGLWINVTSSKQIAVDCRELGFG